MAGSKSKKFVLYSAVYSLLLLLPGIWLVSKLRGVPTPGPVIVLVYCTVYAVWLFSTVLWIFVVGLLVAVSNPGFFGADTALQGWLIVATSAVNGVIWLMSVRRALKLRPTSGDDLLEFARIEPFVSFIVVNMAIYIAIVGFNRGLTIEENAAPFVAMAVFMISWMLVRIPFFVKDEIRGRTEEREETITRETVLIEADRRHRW